MTQAADVFYWQILTETGIERIAGEMAVNGGALTVIRDGEMVEAFAPNWWHHCIKLAGPCPKD